MPPVEVTRTVPPYVTAWEQTPEPVRAARLAEMAAQEQRRRALLAATLGHPDPGYTYPGAHFLAGVAA